MKARIDALLVVAVCATSFTHPAMAQDNWAPSPEGANEPGRPAPSQEPDAAPPAEAPPAEAPTVEAPTVEAPEPARFTAEGVRCELGDHEGIDPAEARTALRLVCEAISEKSAPTAPSYRLHIGKLGSRLVLWVAVVENGEEVRRRQLIIDSMEEVAVAAPRMATALLEARSVEDTAETDTLVGTEAQTPRQRSGRTTVTVGALGMTAIGFDSASAIGLLLSLNYELPQTTFAADARFSSPSADSSLQTASIGVTGRRFLDKKDFSPFLGAGLGIFEMGYRTPDGLDDYQESIWGMSANVSAGVQFLRSHRNHVAVGGRADFPTFQLGNQYAVPITLFVEFTLD